MKLCYVTDSFAFFTPLTLEEQWGDDWNDKPYQHNAGEPYEDDASPLLIIGYRGAYYLPEDSYRTPLSVKMLNERRYPWLSTGCGFKGQNLYAGASPEDFIRFIQETGGDVFLKTKNL